ncbi:anti-sigma factor family protein [Paracoccus laeviglucosivorans]|uniref:Transmembrane transcriptional regulator (Anti-sigma factor RsiW) n=1 Tax=Paracoccus laeviglucosivorans TaxID=1197861 RepID=A0A521F1X0_9RHOB|nr:anti-sigma factor [Paracoccus laeviglucosivorans]SMO90188.1 Transmembrane transcriptional regulator (anti-sigma factor RsiW) [Paracoccus laeviglucosivorans]
MKAKVNQDDLDAYVDGQLDPWQRNAVEEWLGDHPADAARVMTDIHRRNQLRLALALPDPLRCDRREARRLERAIAPRWLGVGLPSAAIAATVAALWLALGPVGLREGAASTPPPAFVKSALAARDASDLRLAMLSQPEAPDVDAAEIRALTGLALPQMPARWTPRDVQVFPSLQGPGVEMILDTPEHGRLSLFIVRADGGDGAGTTYAGETGIAWITHDGVAHVLGARDDPAHLADTAERLLGSLPTN